MRNLILLLVTFLGIAIHGYGVAVPADDFRAHTATAVSVLQQWYNPTNGLWDGAGWWNSANCVDALENEIVANNDTNYFSILEKTFNLNCSNNFLNEYYDDEGWWAEAWIRAYDITAD